MTDDLVKRARELLDGVTPGPWGEGGTDSDDWWVDYDGGDCAWCFVGPEDSTPVAICVAKGYRAEQRIDANSRFVAASRDLVPAMADRLESLKAENAVLRNDLGELRMCVNCGRTAGVDHNRALPLPDCASPDACTFDLTPNEAWQHWRKKAHDLRTENAALRDAIPRAWELARDAAARVVGGNHFPIEGHYEGQTDAQKAILNALALAENTIRALTPPIDLVKGGDT